MTLPKLENNRCPSCKEDDLTLCEDHTQYRDVQLVEGHWNKGEARYESIDGADSVRLLCNFCGEYMEVPEELK